MQPTNLTRHRREKEQPKEYFTNQARSLFTQLQLQEYRSADLAPPLLPRHTTLDGMKQKKGTTYFSLPALLIPLSGYSVRIVGDN
jgi:hypothetical protein|mmetsp:Transcript_4148/g.9249  ORF Transcript_4148/g.9249 Transcript_4148/m.9249 type:complete len:85 (-) Transcript_4148:232-486(-)